MRRSDEPIPLMTFVTDRLTILSTPFRLLVPQRCIAGMFVQAVAERPNECCGLLAGILETIDGESVGRVIERYPLVNALAGPREFESEPHSLFDAVRNMRQRGLEILAVYHSHPTSDPIPSRIDLARNYIAEVVNLIISLKGDKPEMRAWWLTETGYREADWTTTEI